MKRPALSALVLQGGGALGAYELGAARALYKEADFAPDVIAGVSIGAITAILLARPTSGRRPLEALEGILERGDGVRFVFAAASTAIRVISRQSQFLRSAARLLRLAYLDLFL